MAGQGSTGNVIAALCSFFIPGLGQLLQGRLFIAIINLVLAGVLWFFLFGLDHSSLVYPRCSSVKLSKSTTPS